MQHPRPTRLFDFVVVVGLKPNEEKGGVVGPFIKHLFPSSENSMQVSFMKSIPDFCFPDLQSVLDPKQRGGAGVEKFSFVLTDTTGEKRWAYCQRTKVTEMSPRDSAQTYPHLCFCIVTFIPCFSLFAGLLDEILALHRSRMGDLTAANTFLAAIYEKPLPPPGETLRVTISPSSPKQGVSVEAKEYAFKRPDDSDSLLGNVDFEPLLTSLSSINVLSLFASLLVERRIIFIADKLSTLSTCVQAAMAVLYPLTWQQIFIPVLPKTMLTICCAPMPFVVGILRSCLPFLAELSGGLEEEIIVVDIDKNKITSPKSLDDKTLLPPTLITPLLSALQGFAKEVKSKNSSAFSFLKREKKNPQSNPSTQDGGGGGGSGGGGDSGLTRDISNSFIAFMVDLLKDYRDHLVNTPKKGIRIDREGFIASRQAEVRPLLQLVVQTQMFDVFLQDRATRLFSNGAFERMSVMIEGKISAPVSRFTMYENGDISREDITKKVREMLQEAEEKEKDVPGPRRETVTRSKGGFADFWYRLWNDEPEQEITIGGPDHSTFKKVPHPNQKEAFEWLKSTGREPTGRGITGGGTSSTSNTTTTEGEIVPEWKSAEVEAVGGDKPDGRVYCLEGEKCSSKDPAHWANFQHLQKYKEGPVFVFVRAILAQDDWQPRWCILGLREVSFFKGNDNPALLVRHELKNIKSVTLRPNDTVRKRRNCLIIERAREDCSYISTQTIEEARNWLVAFEALGIYCTEEMP